MKNGLTKRQKEFADEYMKTGNATESAIKAGYSTKTAYAIGNEALKKSKIKEYINQKQEKIEEKKKINNKFNKKGLRVTYVISQAFFILDSLYNVVKFQCAFAL